MAGLACFRFDEFRETGFFVFFMAEL